MGAQHNESKEEDLERDVYSCKEPVHVVALHCNCTRAAYVYECVPLSARENDLPVFLRCTLKIFYMTVLASEGHGPLRARTDYIVNMVPMEIMAARVKVNFTSLYYETKGCVHLTWRPPYDRS